MEFRVPSVRFAEPPVCILLTDARTASPASLACSIHAFINAPCTHLSLPSRFCANENKGIKDSACIKSHAQRHDTHRNKRHTYALPAHVKGACIVSSASGEAANAKVYAGTRRRRAAGRKGGSQSTDGCSGGTRARVLRLHACTRRGGRDAGECRARFRKETPRNRRRVRDTAKASQPEPRTRPRTLWVPEHLSQYVGAAAGPQRSGCCSDTRQYRT